MTKYVVGFAFKEELDRVLLIEKNRPEWQKGKLNGIGGHIEPGEFPVQAMVREFKEEAGVDTLAGDWIYYFKLRGVDWSVYFFYTIMFKDYFDWCKYTTDEMVYAMEIDRLNNYPLIDNLKWLIPMAIYHRRFPCEFVNITEDN